MSIFACEWADTVRFLGFWLIVLGFLSWMIYLVARYD